MVVLRFAVEYVGIQSQGASAPPRRRATFAPSLWIRWGSEAAATLGLAGRGFADRWAS